MTDDEPTKLARSPIRARAEWTMSLDEIEKLAREALERLKGATPAPWAARTSDQRDPSNGYYRFFVNQLRENDARELVAEARCSETDAKFIAAARTDVPKLANAVLELVEKVRKLEADPRGAREKYLDECWAAFPNSRETTEEEAAAMKRVREKLVEPK